MVAMQKKRAVTIGNLRVKLNEIEFRYLEFLATCGFYRQVDQDLFLEADPSKHGKSLNPSFISTPEPSSEGFSPNGLTDCQDSAPHSVQPVLDYLDYTRSLIRTPNQELLFDSLASLLSYFLKRGAPEIRSLRRISRRATARSLGECDLDQTGSQVSATAADSNPTEGSSFEEVMNDLTLDPPPVKEKKKRAKITKQKFSGENIINENIWHTAKKWSEWAIKKCPWLSGKITTEKYYDELIKVCDAVDLNESGIESVFNFIEHDSFWKNNAISPATLLTKSRNGLNKIDNILLQLKKRIEHQNPFYEIESEDWVNPFQ